MDSTSRTSEQGCCHGQEWTEVRKREKKNKSKWNVALYGHELPHPVCARSTDFYFRMSFHVQNGREAHIRKCARANK
jgi:hypothetical protein